MHTIPYLAWLSVATQELSAMPERVTFSFDSVSLPRSVVYSLPSSLSTLCRPWDLICRLSVRHGRGLCAIAHLHIQPCPAAHKRLVEGENICLAADDMGASGWLQGRPHHLKEPHAHGTHEVLKAHMAGKEKLLKRHAHKRVFCMLCPCGSEKLRYRYSRSYLR